MYTEGTVLMKQALSEYTRTFILNYYIILFVNGLPVNIIINYPHAAISSTNNVDYKYDFC